MSGHAFSQLADVYSHSRRSSQSRHLMLDQQSLQTIDRCFYLIMLLDRPTIRQAVSVECNSNSRQLSCEEYVDQAVHDRRALDVALRLVCQGLYRPHPESNAHTNQRYAEDVEHPPLDLVRTERTN